VAFFVDLRNIILVWFQRVAIIHLVLDAPQFVGFVQIEVLIDVVGQIVLHFFRLVAASVRFLVLSALVFAERVSWLLWRDADFLLFNFGSAKTRRF
jgi:hypothetical protein